MIAEGVGGAQFTCPLSIAHSVTVCVTDSKGCISLCMSGLCVAGLWVIHSAGNRNWLPLLHGQQQCGKQKRSRCSGGASSSAQCLLCAVVGYSSGKGLGC